MKGLQNDIHLANFSYLNRLMAAQKFPIHYI